MSGKWFLFVENSSLYILSHHARVVLRLNPPREGNSDSLFCVILVEQSSVTIVIVSLSDLRKKVFPCVVPHAGFSSAGDAGSVRYVSGSFSRAGSSHCDSNV